MPPSLKNFSRVLKVEVGAFTVMMHKLDWFPTPIRRFHTDLAKPMASSIDRATLGQENVTNDSERSTKEAEVYAITERRDTVDA